MVFSKLIGIDRENVLFDLKKQKIKRVVLNV